MPSLIAILACAGVSAAAIPGLWLRQATFSGIATFNDFATQAGAGGTVCGTTTGNLIAPEDLGCSALYQC